MGEGDQPVKTGSTWEALEKINSCDGKDVGKQQSYGGCFLWKDVHLRLRGAVSIATFPCTLHTQVSHTPHIAARKSCKMQHSSLWKLLRSNHHFCEGDWRTGAHPLCLKLTTGAGFLDLRSSVGWIKLCDNRVSLLGATLCPDNTLQRKSALQSFSFPL